MLQLVLMLLLLLLLRQPLLLKPFQRMRVWLVLASSLSLLSAVSARALGLSSLARAPPAKKSVSSQTDDDFFSMFLGEIV